MLASSYLFLFRLQVCISFFRVSDKSAALLFFLGETVDGGGEKHIVRFLGGGGGTYCRASESGIGLVCALFSLRKMKGGEVGGTYHGWGSKTVFGEGFYGMFSPPLLGVTSTVSFSETGEA